VVFVDHFGNLITNIPGAALPANPASRLTVWVGEKTLQLPRVRTYAEAAAGTVVALVSSAGTLEIAVPHGSAAGTLGVRTGTRVKVAAEP
jgi:S-adenosylmethionine hydrolase